MLLALAAVLPSAATPASETAVASIAHVIQLAIAPVFLVSGIGALLGVLTNRLARIVDRARVLEAQLPEAATARREELRSALNRLAVRARLISWAISLCTGSALLVCAVIVVLFIGTSIDTNLGPAIAVGFVTAMLSLIGGLLCFLREIYLATRQLRIGVIETEDPTVAQPAAPARRRRPRSR